LQSEKKLGGGKRSGGNQTSGFPRRKKLEPLKKAIWGNGEVLEGRQP